LGRQATHGAATAHAGEFSGWCFRTSTRRTTWRDSCRAILSLRTISCRRPSCGVPRFDSYRGGDSKSWLLAIVRNCSFSWAKASRADIGGSAPDPDELPTAAGHAGELAGAWQRDRAAARHDREVAGPVRETLILRELEELSYKQIAQITGAPVGTVMSRLARARRMLSDQLEPRR